MVCVYDYKHQTYEKTFVKGKYTAKLKVCGEGEQLQYNSYNKIGTSANTFGECAWVYL